jgi:hypothetical protein
MDFDHDKISPMLTPWCRSTFFVSWFCVTHGQGHKIRQLQHDVNEQRSCRELTLRPYNYCGKDAIVSGI